MLTWKYRQWIFCQGVQSVWHRVTHIWNMYMCMHLCICHKYRCFNKYAVHRVGKWQVAKLANSTWNLPPFLLTSIQSVAAILCLADLLGHSLPGVFYPGRGCHLWVISGPGGPCDVTCRCLMGWHTLTYECTVKPALEDHLSWKTAYLTLAKEPVNIGTNWIFILPPVSKNGMSMLNAEVFQDRFHCTCSSNMAWLWCEGDSVTMSPLLNMVNWSQPCAGKLLCLQKSKKNEYRANWWAW